jgi:hypothetical protein
MKQIVVRIEEYHLCELQAKRYPTPCCQGYLHMQRKLLGIIDVELDVTGQKAVIYTAFVKYVRKIGIHLEMYQLLIDFKET